MAEAQAPVDPVAMIQAQLDAEKAPPPEEKVEAAPEAPEGETQPEEEVKPEENKQVEGEDVKEIPLDELEAIALEVTVKGEDGVDVVEKPTVKELREGYMRQKDYQRKTQEVARQRDEVSQKIRQGIESERNTYKQHLQLLEKTVIESVAPEFKGVDWNDLAANDPGRYVLLRNRADQIQGLLKGIQTKQAEVSKQQEAEQSQAQLKAAQEASERLSKEIPGFNDDLKAKLIKAGEEFGFKPDEVKSWMDPRAIKVLHAAYQYQQLQVKPVAEKRVVTPPKVVKPGASSGNAQAQAKHTEAMKRLQSSGRVEDAAAVIRSRM